MINPAFLVVISPAASARPASDRRTRTPRYPHSSLVASRGRGERDREATETLGCSDQTLLSIRLPTKWEMGGVQP